MKATGLTGVILCGGKSTRMGTDKGLILFQNKTLVEQAIDSIKAYCPVILLSTNNKSYSNFGYRLVHDIYTNIGPIGGIYSGLTEIETERCLITACDIPHIEANIFDRMISESKVSQIMLLKLSDSYFQPFPAILSKSVIPAVKDQIENRNYKLQDLYRKIELQQPDHVATINIDNIPLNINTRKDLN